MSADDEDETDLKVRRIKEIDRARLSVGHVIHCHNIESEEVAFQIEAALIDAYPGLANRVAGHGSGDYGCRHIEQIVAEYAAQPFRRWRAPHSHIHWKELRHPPRPLSSGAGFLGDRRKKG